ncbi:MAG TPA: PIG-L family deacetylase [Thermomicrobiales bacterium]|jgi:LmbE family N-acetylglucosaminyl deacetylase|nr:PIG-L family deacetylase [Thermomicrobiales bacterium]
MTDRTAPVSGEAALEALRSVRRHVVLSPHYDDMPLSIGGSMALAANSNSDVVSLIVFGSEPTGIQLHAFAQSLHAAWGLAADEVIARRRAEEAVALAHLGATMANLRFHDAIYRGSWYTSHDLLFNKPAAEESDLPADVAAETLRSASVADADPGSVRFYAPLGVGRHVDHQTTLLAARRLAGAGHEVWLYEDLPYSLIGTNLPDMISLLNDAGLPVSPAFAVGIDTTWERKMDAIMAYPSQLVTVFRNYAGIEPDRSGIDRGLSRYHRGDSTGPRVERFWRFAEV